MGRQTAAARQSANATPLDVILPILIIDVMLQPSPPARLGIPHGIIGPDRLQTISDSQLLEEEIRIQDALIVRYAEREEGSQPRLERNPDPCPLPSDLDHRLVDEDRMDELPFDIEPVTQRSQSLDPIPYRDVAPLDERL